MSGALDEIRRLELEVAQALETERTRAAERVAEAHREARAMMAAATEQGRAEADRTHVQQIDAARQRAGRIRTEGSERAARLVHEVAPDIERTVDALTELVLSPPGEWGV